MRPECGQNHSVDRCPRWVRSGQITDRYCCCSAAAIDCGCQTPASSGFPSLLTFLVEFPGAQNWAEVTSLVPLVLRIHMYIFY